MILCLALKCCFPSEESSGLGGWSLKPRSAYNAKSELTAPQLGSNNYSCAYDSIGNRKTAQELAEEITYSTNSTNEYTAINDFPSEFDAQTATKPAQASGQPKNRPVKFTKSRRQHTHRSPL